MLHYRHSGDLLCGVIYSRSSTLPPRETRRFRKLSVLFYYRHKCGEGATTKYKHIFGVLELGRSQKEVDVFFFSRPVSTGEEENTETESWDNPGTELFMSAVVWHCFGPKNEFIARNGHQSL